MKKYLSFILLCLLGTFTSRAGVNMRVLGDSLMAYTGFSRVWSPTVRVKSVRVDDDHVIVRTNATLSDVSWTPASVEELKKRVSQWVLGNDKGTIEIWSGNYPIDSLITDCGRGIMVTSKHKDLRDKHIALWPSHGLYYNKERDQWIWQRATLWTTVEDLYSQEYVRLLKQMLENAGAEVHIPRAGIDQEEEGMSGMPRWTEGARYWMKRKGVPSRLWDLYDGNEYKDDMKCRGLWVNYLCGGSNKNPDEQGKGVPIDLCLALHTDGVDSGDDSTIIGTLCIYTAHDDNGKKTLGDGRDRQMVNRNLADWIQTQITNDLQAIVPDWTRRQLKEANYCESRVPVVPSLILELLSHKNMADMYYGLDPKFRQTAVRAIYKGILRYLNGKSAVVQPLPIEQLSISRDGTLRWIPQLDSLEKTAKPTYYMVYVQEDDGEWNVQQVEKKTETKLDLKNGVRYNCYVVAGNDGGLSLPSPIVGAYISQKEDSPCVLIVDAFSDVYGPEWFADSTYAGIVPGSYACEDRISCAYIGQQWDYRRDSKWLDDDNCGWGSCYRDHAGLITVGNTHDYSVSHGRILQHHRISYVSATSSMAQIDSTYKLVDIVCGRQRTPLDSTLQQQVTDYLAKNGRILISAERLSALDTAWSHSYLHFSPRATHATRSGRIVCAHHKVIYQVELEPNDRQLFCASPEAIQPFGANAKRIAHYEDMRYDAAIGWRSEDEQSRTLVWAFPLEATSDFDRIYHYSIRWLLQD